MIKTCTRAAVVAAALTMSTTATIPAWADVKDYEFQLVSQEVKKGDAVIAVKLVHKPSGRAIPDAVIFAKRLDMGPDNMADMQAKLDPVPGSEPGVYQFKTNLDMAGRWALTLGAKVQGETGTVQTKVIVNAK
jgi:YtkA-like